ncbi:MAG: Crp/Fnr family transcriptional regulator, partial [Anaerolineales bacterium]
GDDWPMVLFVGSGEISWALLSPAGKEKILFTIKPGEDFWAHSIFDGKPMPASLYAIGDTKIRLWNKDVILSVIQRNPEAIWAVTCRLIGVMRHAREIIYGMAFQPVSARLSQLILDRFHDSVDPLAERDLTLDQLAAMISSTPQVVCRVMYQFQEEGLLELSRATIKLLDPEGLKKISEGH